MYSTATDDIFSVLEKQGLVIPQDLKEKITEDLTNRLNYRPRIGIFGKTGVGKSSFCNALFGTDICEVSDIEACTRNSKEVLLRIGESNDGMTLLDVPGVSENIERDAEYRLLYQSLLPELDAVFWLLKADERAYAADIEFFLENVKPYMDRGKPFFIILNQIDKIHPFREWNLDSRQPGPTQTVNIESKINVVAREFGVANSKVIPVSAMERYNLVTALDELIFALPDEQKVIVITKVSDARHHEELAGERVVSDEARADAGRGLWRTIDKIVEKLPIPEPIKTAYKAVRATVDTIVDWGRSLFSGL